MPHSQLVEFAKIALVGGAIGALIVVNGVSCTPVSDSTVVSREVEGTSLPAGQINIRDFDKEIAKERRRVAAEIVHSLGHEVAGSARLAETSQKPEGESPEDRLKRAMSVMIAIAYQSEPGEGFNLFAVPREHVGIVESFARTLKCEMQTAPGVRIGGSYLDPPSSIVGSEKAIGGDTIMRIKKRGE